MGGPWHSRAMERECVLVTGASGLIGKELVLRLVRRGARVHVLVRPDSLSRIEARLRQWSELARGLGGAVEILRGDVTTPDLGLDPRTLPPFDHAFHLAGLYDLRATRDRLFAVNVEGTRNVIALLRRLGFTGTLHHASSIAIAGDHAEILQEDALEVGQKFVHPYHRSKYEAEKLVRAVDDLKWRIYRPSAVVGHSQTGEMDRIDGPYFMFKPVQRLGEALPRWFPLVGFMRDPMNIVPVDFVAAAIDTIAHASGLDGKTFHVVDPSPPTLPESFNLLARAAKAPQIKSMAGRFIARAIPDRFKLASGLASIRFLREELLRDFGIPIEAMGVANWRVRFDTTNLVAGLQGTGVTCPQQHEYMQVLWDYWERHLDPDRDPEAKRRAVMRGKHVVITGASSGIGRDLAMYCGELGARPLLVARSEDKLVEVVSALRDRGVEADYVVADLADMEACDRAMATLLQRHGHVDVLVNNAGRSIRRPAFKQIERFHDFERTMQINFFAAVRLIRAVLPAMRERKSGAIVNVLSAGARMPAPNFIAYSASKAALAQLTDTLATELLGENVHCAAVYPSWVRTPMMGEQFKDNAAMSPRDVSHWIIDAVVDRRRMVLDGNAKRRYIANIVTPNLVSRVFNIFWRISTDEDGMHPEFAADRMVAKKYIKGGRVM
jgi:NAD(P)-dependent dehydrogenase (short-subunit alcohol dehydrogenase family)